MVATLLKIRFRVLGNTLASNPWQLVGFIVGGLWAAGMLVLAWVGLFFLGFAGLEITSVVIMLAGSLLVLGWLVVPLFTAGIDTTLDPQTLAPFPISSNRMLLAIAAAALTGIPGIATVAASFGTLLAYFRWPVAAIAAVVCVPLGVLTCIIGARYVATLVGGGGNRRSRELIGGLGLIVLMLAGPIVFGITQLIRVGVTAATDGGGTMATALNVISWTPIAAAWAVPGDLASGAVVPALVKFLIALATLGVVLWAWRRALDAAITSPRRTTSAKVKAGNIGWFGRVPTGAIGATWGRSQMYWLRDPRYLRQLLIVPIFPVLFLFSSGGDFRSPMFIFSSVLVSFFIAVLPYSDISYDGTAFATVLATGIRGRQDRIGRTLAASVVGVPLVLLASVITVGLSGEWDWLPGILGAALGLLLTGFGICAITSALVVVPVPAPGDSPFKRAPGTGPVAGFLMLAIWAGIGVLGLPAIILAIIGVVSGTAMYGWIALAVGLVMGVGVLIAGILIGGNIFDRNAPALLARLRSFKGS